MFTLRFDMRAPAGGAPAADLYRAALEMVEGGEARGCLAVQVSERVGRRNVVETAQKLGITEPLDGTPAIALGVSETTLLEMTGAYATFANLGRGVWPRGIDRITARDGTVLYERQGGGPGAVASGQAVVKMLDVMAATVEWGTGKKAKLDRPIYGKTGTSQNFRDAWFVGLSRDVVTGVWVGNDNSAPMNKVTGGSLPVAIWHDFMAQALQGSPPEDVRRPQAVEAVAIASPADTGDDPVGSWLSNLLGGDKSSSKTSKKSQPEKAGLRPQQGNNK